MAFEQKDELYRVIVKDPKLPPEELAKHHKELSAAEAKLYVDVYKALDGVELIAKKHEDNTYSLWTWPENSEVQVRDAYYVIEQTPNAGRYINDRETFEEDWESWVYDINYRITLEEQFFEIIETGCK